MANIPIFIGGGGGGITSDELTAKLSDVASGYTAVTKDSGDDAGIGNMPKLAGRTIIPGTAQQIIAAGNYLEGAQTIKGDQNLVPANIVSGRTIFGIPGEARTSDMCKAYTVTSSYLRDYTAVGQEISGSSWVSYSRSNPYVLTIENPGFVPNFIFSYNSSGTYSIAYLSYGWLYNQHQTSGTGSSGYATTRRYRFDQNPGVMSLSKDLLRFPIGGSNVSGITYYVYIG